MFFFNLSSFYFFYFAAVGVYIIFLPKVLHDIGYASSDIGVIFALAPLMRFLTPFLFLKHIKLNQNIFKVALSLSIACALSFYFTINNFYSFLISNLLLGMALSLVLPYVETIAVKELGKERYGKSRLYGSIGFIMISLVLGRVLNDSFTAVHFYLFTTVFTSIFAFIILRYDIEDNSIESIDEEFSLLKYWPFWLSLFFMQMSFGGFYNFFTIYETTHGISLEMTSYLWSFGVICEIVIFYFQAPLLKSNLIFIIKFSILATALRWLSLYLFPESLTMTFISQSLHALSFGLYHSSVVIYLYKLYSNKKLAQQFMYGVAYGLGGFVGALAAGLMYGEYLFLFMSVIAFCSFFALSKSTLPNS